MNTEYKELKYCGIKLICLTCDNKTMITIHRYANNDENVTNS